MKNLKNRKLGRKPYIPNEQLLKELYIKISNKELKNSEAWRIAGCGKTKWYELKKKLEV